VHFDCVREIVGGEKIERAFALDLLRRCMASPEQSWDFRRRLS
jgi:hypothetical protein